MPVKKEHLMTVYISRAGKPNMMITQVITAHLLSEYILNRIITERCPDYKLIVNDYQKYTYDVKLTLLRCMGIVPEKLYHNLKELNALRNSCAHNLDIKKGTISFYTHMDSDEKHECKKSDPNFNNGIEWLCDTTILDFVNLAHDLKIDIKYEE